jgi:hypothetical protein
MNHEFFTSAGELLGDELLIWEDFNEHTSMGQHGKFQLWRRDADQIWVPDPKFQMELLIMEARFHGTSAVHDFNGEYSYTATRFGDFILIGQRCAIFAFGPDESGQLELKDALAGPINLEMFWIRGSTLYFPDSKPKNTMYSTSWIDGKFSPLTVVPWDHLLGPGEVSHVNVRPFRDLLCGSMSDARMFIVGESVDGWTAWDGAFEGQSADHIGFTGPAEREARWYGAGECRFLRHRIDYQEIEGREFISRWSFEGDAHSLVLDGRIYFVCEQDGSAWLVKLIDSLPN